MSLDPGVLGPILATGLAVAFLHAAIPTHWLPFVLAARGQGWSMGRTLGAVLLAGTGHVLLTTLLGALLVFAGLELGRALGNAFAWIAGGALVAIGAFYLWRQWRGGGHGHLHLFGSGGHHGRGLGYAERHPHPSPAARATGTHRHDHGDEYGHGHPHANAAPVVATPAVRRSDAAVILGLVALLTFSPCEGFLPVYVAGTPLGWQVFVLLSVALGVATVSAMILFTWLTLKGLAKLNLSRIERWEAGIQGALFVFLGLLIIVTEAWI